VAAALAADGVVADNSYIRVQQFFINMTNEFTIDLKSIICYYYYYKKKRAFMRLFFSLFVVLSIAFGSAYAEIVSLEYLSKYLKSGDGLTLSKTSGDNTYSLSIATSSTIGGIKLGSDTRETAVSISDNYSYPSGYWVLPVVLHSDDRAVVRIPDWNLNITVAGYNSSGNNATTNGNTWLNFFHGSTLIKAFNIVGTGGTTISSDSSGRISIDSLVGGEPRRCNEGIERSLQTYGEYAGSISFSQPGTFINCLCDPDSKWAEFSIRVMIGNSPMGRPIADHTCTGYNQYPMALNTRVPFNGCSFTYWLTLKPVQEVICDIEATGLDRFARINGIDCDPTLSVNPDECGTIVSGVAIWKNDVIFFNFGNEQWGPGNENTIFLHCAGFVQGCAS
jgi:hypothetical protein